MAALQLVLVLVAPHFTIHRSHNPMFEARLLSGRWEMWLREISHCSPPHSAKPANRRT